MKQNETPKETSRCVARPLTSSEKESMEIATRELDAEIKAAIGESSPR
jgi:hypothetical protein